MNDEWIIHAACRDRDICPDPGIFFPGDGEMTKVVAAKKICAACPVQPFCLREAVANNEKDGVWGGMTSRQLRELRKLPHDRLCKSCREWYRAGPMQRRREFCDDCGDKRITERQAQYNRSGKVAT